MSSHCEACLLKVNRTINLDWDASSGSESPAMLRCQQGSVASPLWFFHRDESHWAAHLVTRGFIAWDGPWQQKLSGVSSWCWRGSGSIVTGCSPAHSPLITAAALSKEGTNKDNVRVVACNLFMSADRDQEDQHVTGKWSQKITYSPLVATNTALQTSFAYLPNLRPRWFPSLSGIWESTYTETDGGKATGSERLYCVGSKVAQRSKALHLSARGVTTDPASLGFGWGRPSL